MYITEIEDVSELKGWDVRGDHKCKCGARGGCPLPTAERHTLKLPIVVSLLGPEMVSRGDTIAKEGMSNTGPSQLRSDQALADHDSKVELESFEKKRKGGGWVTTPFIFGCEAAEGLAGTGARANLVTFLTQQMNLTLLNAATILNGLSAVTAASSLLGAYVADAYLGRFTTIALGSWINLAGLLTLTTVAWDKSLHPPACTNADAIAAGACQKASNLQLGILYLAFGLMSLGSGALRPCVAPFGASQFDQTHEEERKQLKHYFIWFFFTVSFATLLASTVVVYIQDNVGWALGFGIPTVVFLLSIVSFFGGMNLYRYSPPRGSPFTRMAQVIVAAVRKRKLAVPKDLSKLYQGGTNVSGDESEGLERPSTDYNDAHEPVTKSLHPVNDAKVPISHIMKLAGGGQARVAVAANSVEKLDDQQEKIKVEKINADRSKRENTAEDLGERQDVYEKKNDAEEHHLEGYSRDAMTVGPHRGEGENSAIVLRHSDQFRFFDKAAIAVAQDWSNSYGQDAQILKSRLNPWRLSSVQQVEELKCMVRLTPMWATVIPMALTMSVEGTYVIEQARRMNRNLGHFVIPSASFSIFSTITVLIWLPIWDKKIVPLLKRYTGKERGVTFLQKIAVGMALQILGHTVMTLVEHKRRESANHYTLVNKPKNVTIPISAFWLLPQHVIGGLAASFVMIGHMEFFYYMLPEYLTTTGSALFLTATTVGSNLNTVLLHIVQNVTKRPGHPGWLDNNINKGHLDYFYGLLTVVSALNLVFFFVVARWYKRQAHLNQMMVQSS